MAEYSLHVVSHSLPDGDKSHKHGSENSVVEVQYSYQKLDEQISQDVSNSVYLWKKLWKSVYLAKLSPKNLE